MFLMCNLGMHNVFFFLAISDTLKFYTNWPISNSYFYFIFPPKPKEAATCCFLLGYYVGIPILKPISAQY